MPGPAPGMAEKVQRQTLAFLWILDYIIIMWLRKITRWPMQPQGKAFPGNIKSLE